MYNIIHSRVYACLHARVYMNTYRTAILIMIDVRYHDFNGFPAVNWY